MLYKPTSSILNHIPGKGSAPNNYKTQVPGWRTSLPALGPCTSKAHVTVEEQPGGVSFPHFFLQPVIKYSLSVNLSSYLCHGYIVPFGKGAFKSPPKRSSARVARLFLWWGNLQLKLWQQKWLFCVPTAWEMALHQITHYLGFYIRMSMRVPVLGCRYP